MKLKNTLVILAILLVLYLTVGASFVDFYFGGKDEMLSVAQQINAQCNQQQACPQTIDDWQSRRHGSQKGRMIYYAVTNEQGHNAQAIPKKFRIVYAMPMPDHWFEVEGGVGLSVTSGWKSR